MTRHVHPPLTAPQRARARQIVTGCMNTGYRKEALRRMGLYSTDSQKLDALQDYNLELAQDPGGGPCVACGGHFQIQYRPINKGQAYAAKQFCEHFMREGLIAGWTYIKPENVLRSASRSREMSKLRHWGLVAGKPEKPGSPGIPGKRPVLWTICGDPDDPLHKPVPLALYVNGKLRLPRFAVIVHDQLIDLVGPLQSVHEVEGFSVEEYMQMLRDQA
jgi:hypothetical protein